MTKTISSENITAVIESILFITAQPLSIARLAKLTGASKNAVEKTVDDLLIKFTAEKGGIVLQRIDDSVQFVTAPVAKEVVEQFIKEQTTGELSRPSLETLTIIAYRGPVTRAEIEQIRGVNCSIILKNLLIRGLITKSDDSEAMMTTYQVTFEFLQYLGIQETSTLPEYDKLNSDQTLQEALQKAQVHGDAEESK